MAAPNLNPATVTAILGPTNTGKTHYAIERMLGRASGVIGLPLRLLAREVYDKICAIKGTAQCALVTGEEKIIPPHARYFVCTVEAMPVDQKFAFVAIDEVQIMANHERGHVFTDRVLHFRGTEETLLLGAATIRPVLKDLIPDIRFDYRERFSTLSYSGAYKITRLPKRSVIVAFSASEVYAIAELIRRFRGGAAVVMGGLSPRTRNAQAELFQSGDVDFLVATDAVGMGLNLDTDHVAFAGLHKFDGRRRRQLTPMEAAQIAGRAGRFRNNGTFGTTGDCQMLDTELVRRIENHDFEPVYNVEWRNSDLDFSSLKSLQDSLHLARPHKRLRRVKGAVDEQAFERLSAIDEVVETLGSAADVKNLWDICQIPDFRNLTIDTHVKLLQDLYRLLLKHDGQLPHDYFEKQVSRLDQIEGGVDILSTRLSQIRTWTYCANKTRWSSDPSYWIKRTRAVEDRLSDALHENLIERFVDRRTHALLKGMTKGMSMTTSVKDNGEVWVDDQKIGQLEGLSFKIDESASELEAKALQAAATKAVSPVIDRRLTSLCGGSHDIFTLSDDGKILWGGQAIGRIAASGSVFSPDAELIGAEMGNPNLRNLAIDRMRDFLQSEVSKKLEPLHVLKAFQADENQPAPARGLAYTLLQENGSIERADHYQTLKSLDQDSRKPLREIGVVFGQYNVYMPELIKPKAAHLLSLILAYGAGGNAKPFIPFAGVTSIANAGELQSDLFDAHSLAVAGYKACGPRIIRFDILNRLSQLIRQAQNQILANSGAPKGPRKFQLMQEMLAILGATYEETRGVLEALGYKSETITPPEIQDNAKTSEDKTAETEASKAEAPEIKESETKAPEPAPVKTDAPPAATDTTSADASAEPEGEKPAEQADLKTDTQAEVKTEPGTSKAKSKKSRQLNVYSKKVVKEDGTSEIIENNEFWFMPSRKQQGRGQNKRAQGQSNKYRKPKKGSNNARPRSSSAHHKAKEKRRIEDSPFAALAALKTPKDGG